MNRGNGRSPLDRFLGLFAEVKAGEGMTTVLLGLNVFLLLTAYSIIKPVREALILGEHGPEFKSYLSAGQAILLLGVVPAYSALAGRLPRRALINTVTIFFNDGEATEFTRQPFGPEGHITYGIALGDLNGDGFADIVTANSDGPNVVYLNRPARD